MSKAKIKTNRNLYKFFLYFIIKTNLKIFTSNTIFINFGKFLCYTAIQISPIFEHEFKVVFLVENMLINCYV